MKYSVLIPVADDEANLEKCLESLRNLNFDKSLFEVIVADGSSKDDCVHLAKKFGAKVCSRKGKMLRPEALKLAAQTAKGEFLVFLASNCEVSSEWLSEIDKVSSDETIGCIAGQIGFANTTAFPDDFSQSFRYLSQSGRIVDGDAKPFAKLENAAYRRDVFNALELFDAPDELWQDALITWRMLDQTAYRLEYVSAALVVQAYGDSTEGLVSEFEQIGRDEATLGTLLSQHSIPLLSGRLKETSSSLNKITEQLCASQKLDDLEKEKLLEAATQSARLTGFLDQLLQSATMTGDPDFAAQKAIGKLKFCNICGSTDFEPGPNNRLVQGTKRPRCSNCNSLERHRVLYSALSYLGDRLHENAKILMCGEKLPKTAALSGEVSCVSAEDVYKNSPVQRFDICISANYFKQLQTIPIEDAIVPLLSNCTSDGAWIGIEYGGNNARQTFTKIQQLLPNASCFVTDVTDPVTNTSIPVIIASRQCSLVS